MSALQKSLLLQAGLFMLLLSQHGAAQTSNKRALKVLLFSPQIGYSHLQFMASIADTLADAGHQVHVLEILFNNYLRNFTDYRHSHRIFRVHAAHPGDIRWDVREVKMFKNAFDGQFNGILDGIWSDWFSYWPLYCEFYLRQDALFETLAEEHYDVGISEIYDFCPFGIFHRIGIRTTLASFAIPLTQVVATHFGVPIIPAYMTSLMAPVKNGPWLGFGERMSNFWNRVYEKAFLADRPYADQQALFNRKYGNNFPQLIHLARNISFLLINNFEQYELPQPGAPKIVHIGGVVEANWPVREMDQRSADIFARAKRGVVYFSLGSITDLDLLAPALRSAIAHTFGRFPEHQFIWKMDGTSKEHRAQFDAMPNVHLLSWASQRAILAHPKLRAFITHCGRNSMNEAALSGVPVVAVPLFADQPYNAMAARFKGVGQFVDVVQLQRTPHLLADALEKVLNDDTFRRQALLLKRQIASAPFSGVQKLVRYVEYAAEFPGTGLADLNLPTEEELGSYLVYHSLDVLIASACLLCALALLIWSLLKCFLKGLTAFRQNFGDSSKKKNS